MNPMNWWWRWKFLIDPFYDDVGGNPTASNGCVNILIFGTILVVILAAIFVGGMLISNIRSSCQSRNR